MLTVTAIRHAWPEKAGFCLRRPNGCREYVFVHFTNGAEILLDGACTAVPPHSCILYRPDTPQYLYSPRPLIHDWFHFTADEAFFEGNPFKPDTLYHPSHPKFVTDIVREMENEFFAEKQGHRRLIPLKAEELFLKLSRTDGVNAGTAVDSSLWEKLRALRGEIFLSLATPWTVEKMAASVGLSPSRFHMVYRSLYGNSPMDDLIRARIDSAKNMLLYDNRSVSAIASDLGYNNATHFSRQFRKLTAMSPSEYRAMGSRGE